MGDKNNWQRGGVGDIKTIGNGVGWGIQKQLATGWGGGYKNNWQRGGVGDIKTIGNGVEWGI